VKKSAIYSAASHKDHSEDDRQHEVSTDGVRAARWSSHHVQPFVRIR
jgi:hypothetical protein